MVEFSCSSLDRKLAPGENTKVFDVTIPNLPDFYFNCTGVQRCFVRNQLIVALAKGKIIQSMISDAMISEIRMLTCKEGLYFSELYVLYKRLEHECTKFMLCLWVNS